MVILIYKSTIFLSTNLATNYFSHTDYFFGPTKQLKMLVICNSDFFFFFFGFDVHITGLLAYWPGSGQ
jgi:hypothetical protein